MKRGKMKNFQCISDTWTAIIECDLHIFTVVKLRNNVRRIAHFTAKCSWKCVAVVEC